MSRIGTFTKDQNGFTGTITALAISARAIIKPNEKTTERAPDYRIYASGAEIGAAWSRVSKANKPYMSVTLDDPSFGHPIYARLVGDTGGKMWLVWNR